MRTERTESAWRAVREGGDGEGKGKRGLRREARWFPKEMADRESASVKKSWAKPSMTCVRGQGQVTEVIE